MLTNAVLIQKFLKPADTNWQPQDFLPDPESPEFFDQVPNVWHCNMTGPVQQAVQHAGTFLVTARGPVHDTSALHARLQIINTHSSMF